MNAKATIKSVFSYLPYNLQRIFVSPYRFISQRKGNKLDAELMKVAECNGTCEDSFAKFKALIQYAYVHIPYYRTVWQRAGVSPEDIRQYSDLVKLPVIDKQTVVAHYESFLSDEADASLLVKHTTGGSSGLQLTLFYDDNTVKARRLGILKWMHFAGLKTSDKGVWIGRAPMALVSDPQKWGRNGERYHGFYNPVSNRLQLATNNMSPEVLKYYARNVKKFKPDYIQGYASGVATLAHYLLQNGITIPCKAVLTSSERLTPADRAQIEQAFQCEVFDRYGCGEEIVSACECEYHNGYHVESDRCLVEVVDENGRQLEQQIGQIVGTNLVNYAFPLIRYKIGDLGALERKTCPCGRQGWMISELTGRDNEYLVDINGVKQCSSMVSSCLVMPNNILAYQIEQNQLDTFVVRYCSSENSVTLQEEVNSSMKSFANVYLKIKAPKVEAIFCKSIPVSENGKLKYLISHLN